MDREWWARYLILFPLMLIVGTVLNGSGRQLLGKALAFFGLLNAVIAVFEFALRTRLVATVLVPSASEFGFRSGVAAEHPLVLACLLAIAAPFIPQLLRRRLAQVAGFSLLVAGSASTGSLGVTVVLLAYIILKMARLEVRAANGVGLPMIGTVVLLALLTVGAFVNYNDPLIVAVGDGASDIYRLVLYAFSGRALVDAPFGWGVGGIPSGIYVIPSAYGPLDLARTIDSEFVLLITQLGWLGVVVSVAILWSPWLSRNDPQSRWAFFLAVATGYFLALHAWAGLGSVLFILLGIVLRGNGELSSIGSLTISDRSLSFSTEYARSRSPLT